MATTELPTLDEFRVIEAFSRWGAVEHLFWTNPLHPDSVDRDFLGRFIHQAYEDEHLLGLIWSLSSSQNDPRDLELYGELIRKPPMSSEYSDRISGGAAQALSYIGEELVSNDVRAMAIEGHYKLARHLTQEQLEELVGKLDGPTVSTLLIHGLLERTETVARRIIGTLFGEDPMAYRDAIAAFGHGAIIDAVKDDEEFSQLIRVTTTAQAASAKLFLHSEHFRPFHFLDLVSHFEGRQLLRFLEFASGSLQSDSKFKRAADAMLKRVGEPLDEIPDPELAVKSRRAHAQLLAGNIELKDFVGAEADYRIYRGPYERMVKLMGTEPEAFSRAELDVELFRPIREEVDLRIWAQTVRADARREIEVAGLQASLDAMG